MIADNYLAERTSAYEANRHVTVVDTFLRTYMDKGPSKGGPIFKETENE